MAYYEDMKYPSEFKEGDVIDTLVGYTQTIIKLVSIEKEPNATFSTYRFLVRSNISDTDYVVGYKANMPRCLADKKVLGRIPQSQVRQY
ncbi:hypothetical protein [Anaerobacillus sp. 1_MG-2023]|uniref:hypothetical protein n=1 Tax=Anaerobacillus sp. 1_MG-2023 TaxID=3062655 RepID=UPI0026E36D30|nr:hypothetical protein [Anaerobacillus sp. 1_MG-2023]MDO6657451.1 hypothetical protein [Anaerobacillus sp. 1_MG-2023]